MISFLREFWTFLCVRKKFWLVPIFIVMAVFGGLIVLTKGTAVKPAPTAPAHPDAISHVRLLVSTGVSLMGVLKGVAVRVNPRL